MAPGLPHGARAARKKYFADEADPADFEHRTLDYLNELSARRRLTTVFPNEQSPFQGVQLNHLNVPAPGTTPRTEPHPATPAGRR